VKIPPENRTRQIFRARALARYQGPVVRDIPDMLPAWHPGLWYMVVALAAGLILVWLIR